MRVLRSKKSRLVLLVVCILLTALTVSIVGIKHYRTHGPYETITTGNEKTGYLRITVPREMQLRSQYVSSTRTIILGPVRGPKNVHIAIEQEEVDHLSTVEREGHLDVYAYDLMHRLGLSEECEIQEAEKFLFFEYEIETVYDRYADNPQQYMEYGLIAVYRGPGQQGYLWFRCHADDKDMYREEFFEIAKSLEYIDDYQPKS